MEKTKDHDNYVINLAMGYGGRTEIIDACKKVAQLVKEGKISPDDVDLLFDASKRFKQHALIKCDGVITSASLKAYLGQELSQPVSPLSKLFASRVRGRRCDHCGHISKLSRLP